MMENITLQAGPPPQQGEALRQVAINQASLHRRAVVFLVSYHMNDLCKVACVVGEDVMVRSAGGVGWEALSAVHAVRVAVGQVGGSGGGTKHVATGSFRGHHHVWQVLSRAAGHFSAYLGIPAASA